MENNKKLKAQINPQGSEQFLTGRKELLDSFDKARIYSKLHEVETYHGVVAESQYRKWLTNFLPKKYGVTSGYIISQGLPNHEKAPHYDVIIYDALESPVLWVEDHSDVSEHGKSRAIPAEYVTAVLEIKASFNSKTVNDAINHLKDLEQLMETEDDADEPYKVSLPKNFVCGLVFFELKAKDIKNISAVDNFINAVKLKGFLGGIILRGEGRLDNSSGSISLLCGPKELNRVDSNTIDMIRSPSTMSKSIVDSENNYYNFLLAWTPSAFSTFSFHIISTMNGTYRQGFISSFHGFTL